MQAIVKHVLPEIESGRSITVHESLVNLCEDWK